MAARVLFFAGKGGVGKTTCAAARAVIAAAHVRSRTGRARVLLVSTDPAHSLGDALGVRLTARPRAVWPDQPGGDLLHAVELDAPRAFTRWLRERRPALAEILERGTWLDREDIDAVLGLSIPGIDELAGLIEVAGFARSGTYSLIVVDTAPTGHTLRLFAAPGTVEAVAAALDDLQRDHRAIRERFAGAGTPDAADRLIADLAAQAQEAAELLHDAARTLVAWVLAPEELSIAETEDGLAALAAARLAVGEVIVNRVIAPGPPCPICDRRREYEHRLISSLSRRLGTDRPVRIVTDALREPCGRAPLTQIGRQLIAAPSGSRPASAGGTRATAALAMRGMRLSAPPAAITTPPESLPPLRGARLLFFGGKGGVGKTTCAAAAALRLARAERARRFLLLSTDPAHSLADVLGVPVDDRDRPLPGALNLHVRELDAVAALAARRARIEAALEEVADAVGAAGAIDRGGAGVSRLLDLAPPGIDELLGVISVVEAERQYDTLIVDTAPTGHTLRLLHMPGAAREWLQTLLRVLLKYRRLVRPGTLGAELVALSKSVRRLQDLLREPRDTRFILVTRAAAVPRLETERLRASLRALGVATPAILCNALTLAPGRCPRCRRIHAAEQLEFSALQRTWTRDCAIILAPLAAAAPCGAAALIEWASSWSTWHPNPARTSTASSRTGAGRH